MEATWSELCSQKLTPLGGDQTEEGQEGKKRDQVGLLLPPQARHESGFDQVRAELEVKSGQFWACFEERANWLSYQIKWRYEKNWGDKGNFKVSDQGD